METRRALLVDAFAAEPLAGNAAGVVPDAEGLSDDQMAAVAAELGASETAFLTSGDGTTDAGDAVDDRLRYFSPTTEVDLCGHATIATYGALFAEGAIDGGELTLRTNVGDLTVAVDGDGTVWMRQQSPSVEVVDVDLGRIADALGVDPAALRDVGADLPVAVASTGLPFLVVPVNFLERLGEADPDDGAVERLSGEFDVAGVYAFTFDALNADSTLHGRAFAPEIGVSEDPVTGTASGAVGGYLRRVDAFDGDEPDELRFEQGHFLDRPGHVRVRVEADGVRVGGRATVALDGEIRVPDDEDDGIVEA
ncbi:PhzF family phenazine biosynthesis protein [Halorubrum sp. BOL3-1]|uniref:PhzF family phenazine biosynthesis protein n=1 Tax=Halorubrum sp. BOL3-1 TaxID=2497325 RepID=UPI001004E8C8|nr:PhzF family phenazine biosynthesis protein [Halorubrum sp. BOL3-1]QAU12566.1 PhzF family phenazine biosynthesis protein [Halorubrum sp. BOL3-1]